ncbi:MAG: hypothetical protein R3C68_17625 [Myxococcota bacterium]
MAALLVLPRPWQDRLSIYGQLGVDWRIYRDLVVLGRAQEASVANLSADGGSFAEGQFLDVGVGMALRPLWTDRYGGLMKWTRRYEREPVRSDLTQFQLRLSDVLSIEPFFELGWGFQVVSKLAIKVTQVQDADISIVHAPPPCWPLGASTTT